MSTMSCWERCCDRIGIGCCIDEDEFKRGPLAEVVQNDHRHCTDLPCLIAFVAVLVFEFYLIIYASGNGADPDYLLHGFEYNGALCDNDNPDGRYNAWPDLSSSYNARICVSDCNQTRSSAKNEKMYLYYASESCMSYLF